MKFFFLYIFFFSANLFAQDSLVVKQVKSVMFSNKYVFYSNGIFKHYFQTDDAQIWYGTGIYKDYGRKRILKFNDPDLNFKREYFWIHYEANFELVLKRTKKGFKSKDYYNTSKQKTVLFE